MDKIKLGRIVPLLKGEYSSSTSYVKMDIVTYQGSSYWCVKDCTGMTPTNTTYWQLIASKGGKGDDAVEPFKGWFASSSALTTKYPSPSVGDFAYVKGSTDVNIYSCTTAGTWTDSGTTFNPANNQEFASGQSLNTVHIVDGLDSSSSTDVLSAKQGKELNDRVTALGPKIDEVGEFKEVPVFIRAITDSHDRVLWGITADGDVYFGKGCPQQVKDYIQSKLDELCVDGLVAQLYGKVDKVDGKGLTSNDYTDDDKQKVGTTDFVQDPMYVWARLDSNNKLLEGITKDGLHYIHNVKSETLDELKSQIDAVNTSHKLPNHKLVAAYNAPDSVKAVADYVCDGENDEIEINTAMREGGTNAVVTLSEGDFNIDEFKQRFNIADCPYTGITLPYLDGQSISITLQGCGSRGIRKTTIHARGGAWTNVPDGVQPSLIGTLPWASYNSFNLNDFAIRVEDGNGEYDNQKKIVCINCSYLGGGDIHHITMYAHANSTLTTPPAEGCVGFRSWRGSDTGTIQVTRSVVVIGFYEAFQLGAEHHTLINCGGRFNYYCFTFGNYDYIAGYNIHPIVLINCMDEHSVKYPKFVNNGMYDESNVGMQSVTMLGFNFESQQVIDGETTEFSVEQVPGTWCGHIEYTVDNGYFNGVGTRTRFWADGSGHNFTTRNLAHAPSGTTALRNTYLPNYMQHYFDTDLGKELIYNGSAWVDCMGNAIV